MGMYDSSFFPQTNTHEINLDWILKNVKDNNEIVETINKAYTSGKLNGRNFAILAIFENWSQLTSIVDPRPGDCYAVGASAPYRCYMYIDNDWVDIGDLSGKQGDPGTPGTNGTNGKNATIVISTTSTGEPGTNAKVENLGDENNAILKFTIPRGFQGEQGEPGTPGKAGANGEGVPTGGETNQILYKKSETDFDTAWTDSANLAPVKSVNGLTGNVEIDIPSTTQTEYATSGSGSFTLSAASPATVHSFTVKNAGTYAVTFCLDLSPTITNRMFISFGQSTRQTIPVNVANPSTTLTEIMTLKANSTINWYVTSIVAGTFAYDNMIFSVYKLA